MKKEDSGDDEAARGRIEQKNRMADTEGKLIKGRRKQNAARATEAAILADRLLGFFRVASSRFAPPNERQCGIVAQRLISMRDGKAALLGRGSGNPCRTARRYASLFLKHAPRTQATLDRRVTVLGEWVHALAVAGRTSSEATDEPLERFRAAACRFVEATRAVEAARHDLDPQALPGRDPVRMVAGLAQQAWAHANDGNAPRGKNADDPLVKFVVMALPIIGENRTAESVSAILRGRRRKKDI